MAGLCVAEGRRVSPGRRWCSEARLGSAGAGGRRGARRGCGRAGMVDVFSGRLLVSRDGRSVDPEEALQNKVVGLYFSAGWCSPCRDFTPVLCDFYTELLEETEPPAPFEVVFISSDHSAEEMVGYMRAMHGDWLALPFHDPYKQ